MSSPDKVNGGWFFGLFTSKKISDEERDALLFGPLGILEVALRILHPAEANIKYVISDYRLNPLKIEDYQIAGKSYRSVLRMLINHEEDGEALGVLMNKIDEFISWYLLDNPNPQMKNDIQKLLEYTKEGFALIAALPDYNGTNTGRLLNTYVTTIDLALKGRYPHDKQKMTEFGAKARALLSAEELNVIMNIFNLAITGNLKKESAIEQIESKMTTIQAEWVHLKNEATSVSLTHSSRRRSVNEEEDPSKGSTNPLTSSGNPPTGSETGAKAPEASLKEKVEEPKKMVDEPTTPNEIPVAIDEKKIDSENKEEITTLASSTEEKGVSQPARRRKKN